MTRKDKNIVKSKIEFCKDMLNCDGLTEVERARLEAKVDCLSWLLLMTK